MSTSGDVESTSNSPRPAAGSPRTKVKFLCSYGGKILPRPADGHLKYVGGETRVISVPRNITFTGLMKKLISLIDGDVTLKYQLIPEELDALVTVKSDEDLHHMFEEYDRHDFTGTPRLRTFLFPASPIFIDNQIGPVDRHSLEQRYINSVNGIIFNPTPMLHNSSFRPPAVNTGHTSFTISSACSSPRTPPETATPTGVAAPVVINPEMAGFRNIGAMTRARSSPNLCDLSPGSQPNYKNLGPMSTLNLSLNNQQYPYYQHHHHRQPPPPPPPQPQPHHHHPQPFPKPPLDPSPHKHSGHSGSDHFMRMRSSGLADYYRHPTDHNQHTSSPYARSSRGGGHVVYQRGSPYDEYYGNNRYDRESPPGSPLARSPLHNNYASRWDSVGGR